jgi:L-ascorbate metabolism protein UlaG (beta-lactamase superfamily)
MPDRLRWLGHSTVLLELDGVRVLTDPLLRRRVLHLRRAVPLVDEPLDRLDAVLVSHLHYDHLDPPSLRRLDPGVTVVVPTGAGKVARGGSLANVQEVTVGETVRVGGIAVRAVRAEHGSSRVFGARSEALGYLVEGAGRRVYFPGDTDLYPEMAELGAGLDVALLPIWGWGPSLGSGHLDPRRAAEALALLRPRVVVPIHWGTYYPAQSTRFRLPAFLREPVWAFQRHAAELAPEVEVHVLEVGGELPLAQG